MEPTRFMRMPFLAEGYRITKENMDEVAKWCGGYVVRGENRTPFIHVPTKRTTSPDQHKGYNNNWILLSEDQGEESFKVYSEHWLRRRFIEVKLDGFEMRAVPPAESAVDNPGPVHLVPASTPAPSPRDPGNPTPANTMPIFRARYQR